MDVIKDTGKEVTNGAALAAILSAGIGSFAMGFFVILNSAGLFSAPSLYGPAGGVTGRTTLTIVSWLIIWAVLHNRWKDRHVDPRRVHILTFILIALGIVLTFPPVWTLL